MKKIFFSIVALAALAACSKSEVAYEASAEIGFAPVKGNVTKASGLSGNLATTQELGVWAFWDKDGIVEGPTTTTVGGNTTTTPIDHSKYADEYLVNAIFVNKSSTSWGAPDGKSYPWPVNGSLVFAGYTTPDDAVLAADKVSYDLAADNMTFTNYTNNEFDLCWFGRTPNSYNYRASGTAVPVTLSHALSWISIAVYGEGSTIGWIINSLEWKVPTAGTATCVGTSATWDDLTTPTTATNILASNHTIAAGTITGGKTTGTKITDNLVIPSTPVELTVNYTFMVNGEPKSDSKTVSLKLDNANSTKWASGVHYTYTLAFNANEILVAPSYDVWETSDKSVTVE